MTTIELIILYFIIDHLIETTLLRIRNGNKTKFIKHNSQRKLHN